MCVQSGLTCVGVVGVKLGPAADAGGVQGVNVYRLEKVPQLLDVAVLTVQGHLQLDAHLALICYLLEKNIYNIYILFI